MRIAVIGGGAIGSIVAGRLKQAGGDVVLVARPDHAGMIREKGLLIRGADGESRVALDAVCSLDRACDLAIFTVKTQDLKEAYEMNKARLGQAVLMTTQNGVRADGILKNLVPETAQIISSIVMFGATHMTPGEVVDNFPGEWVIGYPFGGEERTLQSAAKELGKAFSVTVSDDIMSMKWLKVFVNLNNCLPALTGLSMQETFADLDLCRLSVQLAQEGLEIVRQAGIELKSLPGFPVERITGLAAMPSEQAAAIIQKTLTGLSKEPLYGSVLQSIRRGKASEIDFINGELVTLARETGRDAALNRRIVDMVHRIEKTGSFLSPQEINREFVTCQDGL